MEAKGGAKVTRKCVAVRDRYPLPPAAPRRRGGTPTASEAAWCRRRESPLGRSRSALGQAGTSSAFIDLLFASSGIENEIVRRADLLKVLPDLFMPVASIGHLITLKVLAGRHQDLTGLGHLISAATQADLGEARASVARIQERDYTAWP
jgi:hypothetical protein